MFPTGLLDHAFEKRNAAPIELTTFSAAELLAIAPDEPERLFGIDPANIKQDYRALVAHWQQTASQTPETAAVMGHIATLYGTAQLKVRAGNWAPPGVLVIKQDGRKKDVQIPFIQKRDFDLGQVFIGNDSVVYKIDKQYAALADKSVKTIGELPMQDDNMRRQMEMFLPGKPVAYDSADSKYLVIPRKPDLVSLRDARDHVGGSVPPEHIAWIVSSLLNTACYLGWAGYAHNDLSLDTVFVSPEHHYCAVLGGWWYAAPFGRPLEDLPTRSAILAPADVLQTNEADPRVDLDLIRAIGRELSGDPDGLLSPAGAAPLPMPMAAWLQGHSAGKAVDDYRVYKDQVLPESFGPRRFVKWAISPTSIYQPRR